MGKENAYKQHSDKWILCICCGCGVDFYKLRSKYTKTRTHYCSRKCWCKNNKHDKTQCENISKGKTGKKNFRIILSF